MVKGVIERDLPCFETVPVAVGGCLGYRVIDPAWGDSEAELIV